MPTVLRVDGYRFAFWSNENDEPPHVHVDKAEGYAKVWLNPVSMAYHRNFSPPQVRMVREITEEHAEFLLEKWNEFFGA